MHHKNPSNARAHDAKLAFLSKTQARFQELNYHLTPKIDRDSRASQLMY